ncbi:MAG: DUF433 domain-containing protein [Chthoniobacterales bacterium]
MEFPELERITLNPMIMGGKPCIRGMRITVGTIVGLVASGASFEEILQIYPYWESADIRAAVAYAAWQSEEPRNAIADRLRLGTRGQPCWPSVGTHPLAKSMSRSGRRSEHPLSQVEDILNV